MTLKDQIKNLKILYDSLSYQELEKFNLFLTIQAFKTNIALLNLVQGLFVCLNKENFDSLIALLQSAYKVFKTDSVFIFRTHQIFVSNHLIELKNEKKFKSKLIDEVLYDFQINSISQRAITKKKNEKISDIIGKLYVLVKKFIKTELCETHQFEKEGIRFLLSLREQERSETQIALIDKQINLLQDSIEFKANLRSLKFYRERDLIDEYNALYNSIGISNDLKKTEGDIHRVFANTFYNKSYILDILRIEREYQIFYRIHLDNSIGDARLSIINYLQDVVNIVDKLSNICNLINRERIAKIEEYDDDINLLLAGKRYNEVPIVALWLRAYNLLKNLLPNKSCTCG